jgi:tryptophan synthase alpha subunit
MIGIDVSIEMHKKLIKKTKDLNLKIIYLAKLTEEQEKRKHMLKEFDRYVNDSKIWQTQQFAERTK